MVTKRNSASHVLYLDFAFKKSIFYLDLKQIYLKFFDKHLEAALFHCFSLFTPSRCVSEGYHVSS